MLKIGKNLDTLNGGDVINHSVAPSVYVNGKPIATIGAKTVLGADMVEGSESVFAENSAVSRVGDKATSQATLETGSDNVFTK